MSRRAQTELAVLGGLSIEPMTGYALRAAITETLGHFWHESFGQIYPTLAALEKAGLVERGEPGLTSGSQFAITSTGRQRLYDLLSAPIEPTPPRNALLLRLFFGRLLEPAGCRSLIAEVQQRATRDLESYAAFRAELEHADDPNAAYMLLTVAAGEHSARATLSWADEALAILANIN